MRTVTAWLALHRGPAVGRRAPQAACSVMTLGWRADDDYEVVAARLSLAR
jgi:hypothetical protein